MTYATGMGDVICTFTMRGSISTSVAKTVGASIGSITAASHTGCTDTIASADIVSATADVTRPWPITYQSFTGTLPNIGSLGITLGGVFLVVTIRSFGIDYVCTYFGDLPARTVHSAGSLTGISIVNAPKTRIAGNAIFCPSRLTKNGSGSITPAQRLVLT